MLWYNSFSWEKVLLRIECHDLFENVFFSPVLLEGIFFSNNYCEDLVKFLELKFTKLWPPPPPLQPPLPPPRPPPTASPPQTHPHWAPRNWSITVENWLLWRFLLGLGTVIVLFYLTYLMSLQRAVAFPLCSAFYLLLGLSGNFQAPSMTIGKTKSVVFLV